MSLGLRLGHGPRGGTCGKVGHDAIAGVCFAEVAAAAEFLVLIIAASLLDHSLPTYLRSIGWDAWALHHAPRLWHFAATEW